MDRRFAQRNGALAVLLILFGTISWAQSTGYLGGSVVDPQDSIMAGVSVTCRNVGTGNLHQAVTNAEGLFRFPDLPIGRYELTVSREGFQKLVQSDIELLTGHTVELKLKLSVGSVSQQIDVSAEALFVQSASSEVQTTMDSRSMRELPLNGRNPLELVVLTPGADFTDMGTVKGQQDNTGITVNGLRSTDNNYQLDGASFNNLHFGSAPTLPNPDTLEEFTVQSSNYSARESGAGASVQLSTRSGTNQLHGSVFEFVRDQSLDARNFFDANRADFSRHQFGGTLGGPIRRDRTFFFGSYQGTLSYGGPSLKDITVPSQAMRDGNFAERASAIIVDPTNGQPFPNSVIPKSRFDPIAVRLLPLFPLPPPGQLTFRGPASQDKRDHQEVGKVDHALGGKDRLSVRYYYDKNDTQRDQASVPDIYAVNTFTNQTLTIRDTRIINPRFNAIFSFSYSRTHRLQHPIAPFTDQDLTSKVPAGTVNSGPELRIAITGYAAMNAGAIIDFDPRAYASRAQFSWVGGRHLLQFGMDVTRETEHAADFTNNGGNWTFGPLSTANSAIRGSVGDGFASFLIGKPTQFVQSGSDYQDIAGYKYQPWIQDDWKVSRRLTINLGLRWEPWMPAEDHHGPIAALVPGMQSTVAPDAPTGLVFSGDIRNAVFAKDWNNLAPRVGFAWTPSSRSKSVVRAAYGVYYRNVPLNFFRNASSTAVFRSLNITVNAPPSFGDPYGASGGSPFPYTAPKPEDLKTYVFRRPVSTTALDPTTRTGYTQSWNFFLEQEILPNTSLSAGYVGNHSVKILAGAQANPALYRAGATAGNTDSRRPYAGMASITYFTPYQMGNYHALQINLNRRSRRGLSVISNYTFSKALDIGTDGTQGNTSGQPRDPFHASLDHGPSNFDVRHRANIALVYDLPRMKLLGRWQTNVITMLQSGMPFTVLSGTNRSLTGVSKDNADLVGNAARPAGADKLQQWFNTSAFALNGLGTVGTAGRNILRSDSRALLNFALFKNMRFKERLAAQFRMEAFNALNHAVFSTPLASLASPGFGQVQSASDPRVIQLGLKLMF